MEIKLTTKEKTILSCIDDQYQYIARDLDKSLYLYKRKPIKKVQSSVALYGWVTGDPYDCKAFTMFNHLFQFISFEDDKPYNIKELLKGK